MEKYRKIRVLGSGSFGKAILIRRRSDNECFAMKEIPLAQMTTKEREDARNECRVLQRLNHPNIIRYVEHFERRNGLYIVMEYADGGDLGELIRQKSLAMTEREILSYFVQLCLALEYLHSNHILHRDMKSMNVFLTKKGTVKLGDFGISTVLRSTVAMAKTVCGTPFYFSPEICRNEPYNNRSDIWALGIILYECATGKYPFSGETIQLLTKRITREPYCPLSSSFSQEFHELIASLLQKKPEQRPNIRQLLGFPLVRRSLSLLERHLMLATACRIQLQFIQKHSTPRNAPNSLFLNSDASPYGYHPTRCSKSPPVTQSSCRHRAYHHHVYPSSPSPVSPRIIRNHIISKNKPITEEILVTEKNLLPDKQITPPSPRLVLLNREFRDLKEYVRRDRDSPSQCHVKKFSTPLLFHKIEDDSLPSCHVLENPKKKPLPPISSLPLSIFSQSPLCSYNRRKPLLSPSPTNDINFSMEIQKVVPSGYEKSIVKSTCYSSTNHLSSPIRSYRKSLSSPQLQHLNLSKDSDPRLPSVSLKSSRPLKLDMISTSEFPESPSVPSPRISYPFYLTASQQDLSSEVRKATSDPFSDISEPPDFAGLKGIHRNQILKTVSLNSDISTSLPDNNYPNLKITEVSSLPCLTPSNNQDYNNRYLVLDRSHRTACETHKLTDSSHNNGIPVKSPNVSNLPVISLPESLELHSVSSSSSLCHNECNSETLEVYESMLDHLVAALDNADELSMNTNNGASYKDLSLKPPQTIDWLSNVTGPNEDFSDNFPIFPREYCLYVSEII